MPIIRFRPAVITSLVLVTLAGCGPAQASRLPAPSQPAPIATQRTPPATQVPAATRATPTSAPPIVTPQPASAPVPTAPLSPSATVPPAAEAKNLLPRSGTPRTDLKPIWVWHGIQQPVVTAIDPSGTARQITPADLDPSRGVSVSPDGQRIATYHAPAAMRLFDVAAGTAQTFPLDEAAYYNQIYFSPDSRFLALGSTGPADGTWALKILDLTSGELKSLRTGADWLSLVPIGWNDAGIVSERRMLGDRPPKDIVLIDPATGAERALYAGEHITAALTADTGMVGLEQGTIIADEPRTFHLYDIAEQAAAASIPLERQHISRLAWSPDQAALALAVAPDPYLPAAEIAIYRPGETALTLLPIVAGPEDAVLDLTWYDSDTLLVLLLEHGQMRLYTLAVNAAGPAELALIGPAEALQAAWPSAKIVHVER